MPAQHRPACVSGLLGGDSIWQLGLLGAAGSTCCPVDRKRRLIILRAQLRTSKSPLDRAAQLVIIASQRKIIPRHPDSSPLISLNQTRQASYRSGVTLNPSLPRVPCTIRIALVQYSTSTSSPKRALNGCLLLQTPDILEWAKS